MNKQILISFALQVFQAIIVNCFIAFLKHQFKREVPHQTKGESFSQKEQEKSLVMTAPCIIDRHNYANSLFDILYEKPKSRRMAATELGFTDQTYMVTKQIFEWIQTGKVQVVGYIRCSRSGKIVEAVSSNPIFFIDNNDRQLRLFD